MIDKYRALMDGLSLDSLLSFVKEFKSQLFVEGLVQGNVTSTVSLRPSDYGQSECCCFLELCEFNLAGKFWSQGSQQRHSLLRRREAARSDAEQGWSEKGFLDKWC